jgi:hypothetical protein
MQAPDQGQGLIVEHEGRIKQHVNSNPAISLDHRSSPANRSIVGISSTTNEKFPLRSSTIVLNIVLLGTPQSSLIIDLLWEHSQSLDQVEWKDRVSHKEGPLDLKQELRGVS